MAAEEELQRLVIRLIGESESYRSMLIQAQTETRHAAEVVGEHASKIQQFNETIREHGREVVRTVLEIAGVAAGLEGVFEAVKLSAFAESADITYGALLKSAEGGRALREEIERLAETTPVSERALQGVAQTLLKFGIGSGQVVPLLKDFSALAGDNAEQLSELARVYGMAAQSGALYGHQLLLLTHTQPALIAAIAQQMGKTTQELQASLHRGRGLAGGAGGEPIRITFEQIKAAVEATTAAGGQFGDVLGQRANSVAGLFTIMRNNAESMLKTLGDNVVETFHLKDAMRALTEGMAELRDGIGTAFGYFRRGGEFATAALQDVWERTREVRAAVMDMGGTALENLAAWAARNHEVVRTAAAVGIAILAGVIAFKLLTVAVGAAGAVMAFLHLQQVVGAAAWLAWLLVVGAAKVMMFAYNVTVGLYTTMAAAASVSTVAWGAATLATKVAVWLLNGSLTVMNLLLGAIPLLIGAVVVAVAGVLIGAALIPVAAAAYAAYEAFQALMDAIESVPADVGPIKHIGEMLAEWGTILKDVWRAFKVDGDLAWRLLAAGGKLAVSQLADLWPPLWQFIKSGSLALWELVSSRFETEFYRALGNIGLAFLELFAAIDITGTLGPQMAQLRAMMKKVNEGADLINKVAAEQAEGKLKRAVEMFKVVDSARTKAAREEVLKIQGELNQRELLAQIAGAANDAFKAANAANAADAGAAMGAAMTDGVKKEFHKLDAAQLFSAEAFARIADYQDAVLNAKAGEPGHRRGAHGGVGMPAGGGGAAGNVFEPIQRAGLAEVNAKPRAEELLAQINVGIQALVAQGPVEVQEVNAT